jgi:3'(2'), 5'-bisphosphate nucleotidase
VKLLSDRQGPDAPAGYQCKALSIKTMFAALEALAIEAGRIILRIRAEGVCADLKLDGSPVTKADRAAEEHIIAGLQRIDPTMPIIAEECSYDSGVPDILPDRYFLVDPLDGTKEFIAGRSDFTVNIAVIQGGVPAMGVVVAPDRNELFSGGRGVSYRCRLSFDGLVDEREKIATRLPCEPLTAVFSASHANTETNSLLESTAIDQKISIGSSLKFCLVAAGQADIYPRLGRTMQWDTAAGDAVLRNAGGCTLRRDGSPLTYGPQAGGIVAFENPHFVAFGGDAAGLRTMLRCHSAQPRPVEQDEREI